jgi:hypothetical protein
MADLVLMSFRFEHLNAQMGEGPRPTTLFSMARRVARKAVFTHSDLPPPCDQVSTRFKACILKTVRCTVGPPEYAHLRGSGPTPLLGGAQALSVFA